MLTTLFYVLIAYLPFQIALNPYFDIDLMSGRVLILVLFFCWLFSIRRSFWSAIKNFLNFQSVLLMAFLVLSAISLFEAREVFWGIRKILVFCSIFPLYFLTVGILDSPEKIKKVIRILVFSAFPVAIIGILQFLSQFIFIPGQVTNFLTRWVAPLFYGRAFGWLVSANSSWLFEIGGRFYLRAISLFPDPHTFAFYLGLMIPLATSLLVFTKENRKLLLVASSSLIVSLLLTFSRGGYGAMLFTIFIMGAILGKSLIKKLSRKGRLIVFFSSLALAALIFLPFSVISHCFYSSFDFSRYSNAERLRVWEEAFDSIASHPWLGVGIGNFPKVVDPWSKYLSPINAHSTYLDIVSEMGIFALWFWLMLFIGTIFNLVRQGNPISFGLAGSLIWFSCHALVETPIYNSTILAILMIIFGLSTKILKEKKKC